MSFVHNVHYLLSDVSDNMRSLVCEMIIYVYRVYETKFTKDVT